MYIHHFQFLSAFFGNYLSDHNLPSVGTIFTTGAGEYWLTLFDRCPRIHDNLMGMSYIQIFPSFGATGLTLIAFFELVSVMYVYGHKRFTDDIENMTG